MDPHDASAASLASLPHELVLDILQYLDLDDLFQLAQTCQWGYRLSIPLLWKDVELKDCWTLHPRPSRPQLKAQRATDDLADEHDDTPIIKKLLVLATKPSIASHVQTVLHRCHLPTPGIYNELPRFCFRSLSLSQDRRTHKLLLLAIRNMTNVHTLRVIFGHYLLVYGLVWGFLHPHRPRNLPLKRLWLENSSLALPEPRPIGSSYWPDLSGLKSVRVRRLSCSNGTVRRHFFDGIALSRGTSQRMMLQNGIGGEYQTTVDKVLPDGSMAQDSIADAARLDNIIYDALPEVKEFLDSTHVPEDQQIESSGPAVPAQFLKYLLMGSASTLTSLNLDMLLTQNFHQLRDDARFKELLVDLSQLRFPRLRGFQLRNVMTPWTSLPRGTYLLEKTGASDDGRVHFVSFLDFVEAHPNLQCLAWPMDRFFSHQRPNEDVAAQQGRVISNLGRTLVDLRVDTAFHFETADLVPGDLHSATGAKARRWRFITTFAPLMTKIQCLKMEGGIPRQEKHETVRALWRCPLSKIIMIANACPVGNSWGNSDLFQNVPDDGWDLDEEDLDESRRTSAKAPSPPANDFHFEPNPEWLQSSVMLHTVAAFHADTIAELKFCGYIGAPILYTPTNLSHALLSPLRHFHNLKNLTMSMWLDTNFEGHDRDEEVIKFWINTRDPDTTALVVVVEDDSDESDFNIEDSDNEGRAPPLQSTPPDTADPELQFPETSHQQDSSQQQQQPPVRHELVAVTVDPFSGPEPVLTSSRPLSWSRRLHSLYAPHAIATQIAAQIGPFLSERAKRRREGVVVRASFCVGNSGCSGTVFDIDVAVGLGEGDAEGSAGKVLWFEGPREEGEKGRWFGKIRARRWF